MSRAATPAVLYILPYLEAAGTERHVLTLATALHGERRMGLLAPPGPLLPEFERLGVRYMPFTGLHVDWRRGLGEFRRGLRSMLAEFRPDLVHVHAGPELTVLVRTVTRRLPVVLTIHAFHGRHAEANYRLAGWLSRLARVQRVIAVSQSEARLLAAGGLRPPRLTVIYNGIPDRQAPPVDWRAEAGWPDHDPVVGVVARLEPVKGVHLLLEAVARLHREGAVRPRVVVVGDGSAKADLTRQARELGLDQAVFFAGFRADSWRAYGGFSVTVLPSLQDGLPLVGLEAMAAGCPIVASDAGGLPELVEHGETGLIFPAGDVAALTRCLQALLSDPEQARRMGLQGRERFLRHFHVDGMVQQTRAVYDEVVG